MYDLRKERVFNLTKLINRRVTVAGKTTNKNCHEVLGLQVSKLTTKNSFYKKFLVSFQIISSISI